MKSNRLKISNLFDIPDPNRRISQDVPSEIDLIYEKDQKENERKYLDNYRAQTRKRVFLFIKENRGLSIGQIKKRIDDTSGIREWLKDCLVIEKGGKLYIAE